MFVHRFRQKVDCAVLECSSALSQVSVTGDEYDRKCAFSSLLLPAVYKRG
jgi:hypothetical protein